MVMSVMSGEAKVEEEQDAVVEEQAAGGLGWVCVWVLVCAKTLWLCGVRLIQIV